MDVDQTMRWTWTRGRDGLDQMNEDQEMRWTWTGRQGELNFTFFIFLSCTVLLVCGRWIP